MVACDGCGKQTKNRRFCSRSCCAKITNVEYPKRVKRNRSERTCSRCTKHFKSSTKTQVFCSKQCRELDHLDRFMNTLCIDSDKKTPYIKTYCLKYGLLRNECYECGMTEWRGRPAPLELDHINGENTDNRIENLRILCANCHAQTPTYRWKNAHRKRREQMLP